MTSKKSSTRYSGVATISSALRPTTAKKMFPEKKNNSVKSICILPCAQNLKGEEFPLRYLPIYTCKLFEYVFKLTVVV